MKPDAEMLKRLLAHGGWELDDVQARHRENPKTFTLPSSERLAELRPGHTVRLIFAVLDLADQVRDGVAPYLPNGAPQLVVQHERMWLWFEREEGDEIIGVLMNDPTSTHTKLRPGARVRFTRADIIDLDLKPSVTMASEFEWMEKNGSPLLDENAAKQAEDPMRAPTISKEQLAVCAEKSVKPERPWVFARTLVGGSLRPDVWPVYGVRAKPVPDRGDCGWMFWTGDPDLGRAAKLSKFEVVLVHQLRERCPAVARYLALPPGWAFVLGPDGYADVYPDAGDE